MEIVCGRDVQREKEIWQKIIEFNARNNELLSHEGVYKQEKCSFFAVDDGATIGGALCYSEYNWLYIDVLFVDENLRGQDIGSKLLAEVEEFAREKKFGGVFLDTFDFQAKPFYEKNGYKLCGTIENMPFGSRRYTLAKQLNFKSENF
jgi:GNAT superfamily N-acetyltransferase